MKNILKVAANAMLQYAVIGAGLPSGQASFQPATPECLKDRD